MTLPWALPWSTLWSNFVAGATRQGAVHILDRNVVFSCGASNISSHFVRVRVARCAFWIVTWYFVVVPAAAAFQSFCVCVCVSVHVAVCAFWIVRSLRLLRQIPRLKKSLDYNVRPVPHLLDKVPPPPRPHCSIFVKPKRGVGPDQSKRGPEGTRGGVEGTRPL